MRAIGQKLKAIFSLKVSCITGLKHKNDYKKLNEQYNLDLPNNESIMDDLGVMAGNRGLTKRGKDQSTLQALCQGQKFYLPKPQGIRVGTTFGSKNGSLNNRALKYCQMDVEAPLILHDLYSALPDLTKRIKAEELKVGNIVDIMPSATSKYPIAQGTIKQIGGQWKDNKMKLRKDYVLVEVKKVFDLQGVIHYPSDKNTVNKCSCGKRSHVQIEKKCDFYLYSQFGKPAFETIEIPTRLRLYNEMISYPSCAYDGETVEGPTQVDNFTQGTVNVEALVDGDGDEEVEVLDDESGDDEDELIPPRILDLLFGDDDEEENESDMLGVLVDDGINIPPTQKQINIATDTSFNETLEKIIEEADGLLGIDEEVLNGMAPDEGDLPVDELPISAKWKSVLGDLFHFMDRAKLLMHHEYKSLFFRCLRAAIFIMNKDDVEKVKAVVETKQGTSWEHLMAFDFQYIARRVRRRVPPPEILYN